MGLTFAEKILSAKTGKTVYAGEIVTVEPDVIMSHDNSAAIARTFYEIGVNTVKYPSRVAIILDHCTPAATEKYAQNHLEIRKFVKEHGIKNFHDVGRGICHQVLPEEGLARPGSLILGSDSHTTTYGAFGAFAAGIGRTEAAAIWATGELWLRVPETIQIKVNGKFKPNVTPKDLILYIIGEYGADGGLYRAVEFTGTAIDNMSIGGRMTLCNMTAEMGAKIGYIQADDETLKWPPLWGNSDSKPVHSDFNAEYAELKEINAENIEPMIAKPHTVDNVATAKEVTGTKIHQALLGTCTNGRLEDLEEAAAILKGKKVHKEVRLLVFPASSKVLKEAINSGVASDLLDSRAVLMNPGCGPCLGAHEGALAPGEVCISTANRNFKGRMGCRDAEVYLGSPATVAASAIAGEIVDPNSI